LGEILSYHSLQHAITLYTLYCKFFNDKTLFFFFIFSEHIAQTPKGKVCSLAYEVAATCRRLTFTQMTQVNSRTWLCRKYAIKIVLVLLNTLFVKGIINREERQVISHKKSCIIIIIKTNIFNVA